MKNQQGSMISMNLESIPSLERRRDSDLLTNSVDMKFNQENSLLYNFYV